MQESIVKSLCRSNKQLCALTFGTACSFRIVKVVPKRYDAIGYSLDKSTTVTGHFVIPDDDLLLLSPSFCDQFTLLV